MRINKSLLITLFGVLILAGFLLGKHSSGRLSGKVIAKPRVVVSMPLLKHLVSRIGGDAVTVTSIVKGASCNHEYEPTSKDLKQVAGSSLFIKVGLGFDLWVDQLIRTVGHQEMQVFDASRGIRVFEETEHEHEHEAAASQRQPKTSEREADPDHHDGNPHYWGSPDNVKTVARNILTILIDILPEKQAQLTKNYEAYINELDRTAAALKAKVAGLPDKRVVSYSAAFPYFFQYFGFENQATVESTCEQEISPKHLAQTANLIKTKRIKVLVGETVYPGLPVNLAKETGVKLILLWPGTNEAEDYPATLRENVEKLVAALQ